MLKAAGLEYEVRGEGEPVLFIHGGIVCDADLLLMSQPALAGCRLIRYHRRGYAGSAPLSGPISIEDQAQDALALIRALNVKRAHVVGHSYGGPIALQLALDAPSFVHSLVLSEPALFMLLPNAPAAPGVIAHLHERVVAGDNVGAVDAFMRRFSGEDWRTDLAKMLPGAPEQAEKDVAVIRFESPALDKWRVDPEMAKRISQPVLSISSVTESGPVAYPVRKLLHDWLPQAEDYDVLGANHLLQFHSPKSATLVAEGIEAFLARHPMPA